MRYNDTQSDQLRELEKEEVKVESSFQWTWTCVDCLTNSTVNFVSPLFTSLPVLISIEIQVDNSSSCFCHCGEEILLWPEAHFRLHKISKRLLLFRFTFSFLRFFLFNIFLLFHEMSFWYLRAELVVAHVFQLFPVIIVVGEGVSVLACPSLLLLFQTKGFCENTQTHTHTHEEAV